MKKRNGLLIFAFCVVLFLGSFIFGYKMMSKSSNKEPLTVKENSSYSSLEILQEEERISPNTFIEIKINYKVCNHNIVKLFDHDDEVINMTEEQFREYMKENFPSVKIVSFSSKEVILTEERNHLCPNHYIIGESNGKVAIYKIDENGERYLYKVFNDYPISLFKEIDQRKLKEGIVVDSEEELSDVLENYIS